MKKFFRNLFQLDHYHWYEIKHIVKDENHHQILNFTSEIGFGRQNKVLSSSERETNLAACLKGHAIWDSLDKDTMLYSTEIICYLGYFAKQQ